MCRRCYDKKIYSKIRSEKYNPRQLLFKNKRVSLKDNPRIGQCQKCDKKIGDYYINKFGKRAIIKRTGIHHIKYHENNVLKDTIELCVSCHAKIK